MAQQGPPGAANSTPPGLPKPGPASQDAADPLPLLTYSTGTSPCQTATDLSALGTPPGAAGPLATVPTTQMQDFGQVMGQTAAPFAPDDQDR